MLYVLMLRDCIGGSKAVLLRPISDQELAEDEDHPQLMQRLNDLREVSSGFGVHGDG